MGFFTIFTDLFETKEGAYACRECEGNGTYSESDGEYDSNHRYTCSRCSGTGRVHYQNGVCIEDSNRSNSSSNHRG
jgi:DnaJ-class molecular chaperone